MQGMEIATSEHNELDYYILLNLTILFIVYIVLMNLFLIIVILLDPVMRTKLYFKLILLIAVAHFLQGVMVLPLHVEFGFIGGKWTRDPDICAFWHLTDLTLTVVLAILFLMLMFERFFSLTYPQIITNNCLGLLMLLSPWILGTSYVVFLYYGIPSDILQNIVLDEVGYTCSLDYYVLGVYSFFGFLCPAVFIFGFSWANVVILCLLRHRNPDVAPDILASRSQTSTASLVALCFIAMWFPANSGFIMPPEISKKINVTAALYFAFANAALTPSFWLILQGVKSGFRRICCCCCIACCCKSQRQRTTYTSSTVDESEIRMLGHERIQPSHTTKL